MIVDGEREHVLHLKNVLCRFLGVNGGSRTGEQSLQGLGPVFVGDGLRGDGGFSVHPLEHLRSHPAAGLAIDASVIDEEVAGDVLRAAALECRRGRRRGNSSWSSRRRSSDGRWGGEAKAHHQRHGGTAASATACVLQLAAFALRRAADAQNDPHD
jgi:hypothetical protein